MTQNMKKVLVLQSGLPGDTSCEVILEGVASTRELVMAALRQYRGNVGWSYEVSTAVYDELKDPKSLLSSQVSSIGLLLQSDRGSFTGTWEFPLDLQLLRLVVKEIPIKHTDWILTVAPDGGGRIRDALRFRFERAVDVHELRADLATVDLHEVITPSVLTWLSAMTSLELGERDHPSMYSRNSQGDSIQIDRVYPEVTHIRHLASEEEIMFDMKDVGKTIHFPLE
jgi:hypothetical protein